MTQVGNILHSKQNLKGIETLQARNKEIAIKCPKHGDFTYNDLYALGILHNECPQCYKARQEAYRQLELKKSSENTFKHSSGVPLRFQNATFENYEPASRQAEKILALLREYALNFDEHQKNGLSLILCGKTGTGKTHLSCAILRHLAYEHGLSGIYTTAYKAIQEVRASYKSNDTTELQALQGFIKPDLLILDEIGVQYGTDSEQLLLFSILNGRYEELKPTIVVSNLSLSELVFYLGDRIYDRLRENGGGVLTFDWNSWRQKGQLNAKRQEEKDRVKHGRSFF